MKLSRGTVSTKGSHIVWNSEHMLAYQIKGDKFEFFPYAWVPVDERDTYGIDGGKSARELLKIVVENELGLGLWSYTIQGETGERRELSAAETKAMCEDSKFDVSIVAKFAKGKGKGHFLFTPKKPAKKPASKPKVVKRPAARTLKGL